MTLRGFDASSNNLGVPDGTISADFVIEKATEGTGYVNPDCNPSYQEAKAAGKLLGVYHFACNKLNSAIDEADYFVSQIKGYIGEAVLFLDYESYKSSDGKQTYNDPSNVSWAKQWLDRVYSLTGVRPLIYLNQSTANAYDWSSIWNDYALWVARYWDMSPDYNYDMTNAGPAPDVKWPYGYAMWQWTSVGRLDGYNGNLDLNIFYGDANGWRAFARARQTTPVPTQPAPTQPSEPDPTPTPEPTEPVTPSDPVVTEPTTPDDPTPDPAPIVTDKITTDEIQMFLDALKKDKSWFVKVWQFVIKWCISLFKEY